MSIKKYCAKGPKTEVTGFNINANKIKTRKYFEDLVQRKNSIGNATCKR